jgi:hypothetical protein
MTFDKLNDGEFEELIFDLLVALGFKNVNWRRGTGKGGATADQGRDIVADEVRTDLGGGTHFDKWFIQCKHYKSGVPPQKIEDALAWATAERPDVLLIVASNFLSNPAKAFLESYRQNNRPAFRIRIWERKDLEKFLSSQPRIVHDYELTPFNPFLDAHPAHVYYAMVPTYNTIDYFFEQVDKLPRESRDIIFSWPYHLIINPRYREPRDADESMYDTMIDPVDYSHFKDKCYELNGTIAGNFLVRSIVLEALTWLWHCSNPQLIDDRAASNQDAIRYFEARLKETEDPEDVKSLKGCIAMAQEAIDSADHRQQSNHKLYTTFCETVIMALALESRKLPPIDNDE